VESIACYSGFSSFNVSKGYPPGSLAFFFGGKGNNSRLVPQVRTGGVIMGRSWIGAVSVVSTLCGLFATGAAAHPASGIVVNRSRLI
jgi:hypothetical protein